jgi:ribosomal protein S27AE
MFILVIYGGAFLVIVLLAVFFYSRSVQSRKNYTCPKCGERIQMEHMDASHCNSCGAPLTRD